VKQNVRSSLVLGFLGLATIAATGACSDEEKPIECFGNSGTCTAGASSGGSSAGSFSSAAGTNSPSTGGMMQGSAGVFFGTSGTTSTAGTSFGTGGGGAGAGGSAAGGGAGGAGTAGSAGAGTAGAGTAGTGGAGACGQPTGVHTGTALARTCFSITASHCANTADNKDPPANALDGDTMKRWSTGGAMDTDGKYTFTVNLRSAVMVSGVVATTVNGDAPPMIEVSVSTDGAAFTPVACGSVTGDIDVGFTPVSAQYVRLTQKGVKTPNWWSIHELNVYGTGTTCGGGETPAHVCTVNVQ
jgi:hypothetical protein